MTHYIKIPQSVYDELKRVADFDTSFLSQKNDYCKGYKTATQNMQRAISEILSGKQFNGFI